MSDRQQRGTVKWPERKRETEKGGNKERWGAIARGEDKLTGGRDKERAKTGRRRRKIKK